MPLSHLEGDNVGGLRPFGAVFHAEFDTLAFFQLPEAIGLDRGMVDEDVAALVTGDKAVTFTAVEPLNSADNTFAHSRMLLSCVDG